MNRFVTAMIVSTIAIAIATAAPTVAQTKPLPSQTGTVGAATTGDATAERRSYLQQAQDQMKVWDQKLLDFNAKMQVKATDAQARASKRLDEAWTDTKAASSRLEAAGEADWTKAKASFKTASAKLAVAWHKVNPADK